tara:strand:+ start:75481 stop:75690 length:210 start_codon:yes stop_codon:yes gene_type:complete
MTFELTQQEKKDLYICIACRLGIIETGEVMMRASDAERSGQKDKIKSLSREQRDLINRLEDIQYKLLNS